MKHGGYTADAIANRGEIATLLRTMKALATATKEREILRPWGARRCAVDDRDPAGAAGDHVIFDRVLGARPNRVSDLR